jgi:ribosomal protein S8
MVITQGSGYADGNFSHQGTRAVDVRGIEAGIRYPYYAPFDLRCVKTVPSYGEATWQSLEKVRFADGSVDYCTIETVHDNSFNAYVGMVVKQGNQLGNMGTAGYATGVHCHIEFAKGKQRLAKNSYGVWGLTNAVEIEGACFMDNTNIIVGVANWKYLKDVKVEDDGLQGNIVVTLKYGENKTRIIQGLKRISKPGLRIYAGVEDMPRVRKGLGTAIVSTSKGVMTDKQARKLGVGGEVLAYVW